MGGICHCLISPSYGMEKEEEIDTPTEINIRRLKHDKATKPSLADIERLHQDHSLLTTQEKKQWLAYAEAGDLVSLYHLGWIVFQKEKYTLYSPKMDKPLTLILERAKSFYLWKNAQYQNSPEAWVELGILYKTGKGTEKDYAKAMECFKLAADQNFPKAQTCIGELYEEGYGVKQDYIEAMKWYRLAATQNDANAKNHIGTLFMMGEGVYQNIAESLKWWVEAALQNNAAAQHNIGVFFQGQKKYEEAAQFYRLAADQNDAHAQCYLGILYAKGKGVKQNHNESIKLFLKAAETEDFFKENLYLGFSYLKSENTKQFFRFVHNFDELDIEQQQGIFSFLQKQIIEGMYPRELIFKNCNLLTKKVLIKDIGVKTLRLLNIENNKFLDNEVIKILEEQAK